MKKSITSKGKIDIINLSGNKNPLETWKSWSENNPNNKRNVDTMTNKKENCPEDYKKIQEKLRVWKKEEKNGFMRKKIFDETGFVNVTRKKMHNVKKIV